MSFALIIGIILFVGGIILFASTVMFSMGDFDESQAFASIIMVILGFLVMFGAGVWKMAIKFGMVS